MRLITSVALAMLGCSEDENRSSPCAGISCSDHGDCRAVGSSAECDCDPGFVASGLLCIPEGGDSDTDTDTDSDTDTDTDTDTGSETDTTTFCGDGSIDPGEACDDGNDVDDDACRNDCYAPADVEWTAVEAIDDAVAWDLDVIADRTIRIAGTLGTGVDADMIYWLFSAAGDLWSSGEYNGVNDEEDWGYGLEHRADGGFYIVGVHTRVEGYPNGTQLGFEPGEIQFFEENEEGDGTEIRGVAVSDDRFAVAGSGWDPVSGFDVSYRLQGLDGGERWYGRASGDGDGEDRGWGVAFGPDESVIVVGWLSRDGEATNLWIATYDADGAPLWSDEVDGKASGVDFAHGVAVDGDGAAVVVGQTETSNADAFVRKYDVDGNEVWTRALDFGGDEAANDVAIDDDGNIFVCGERWVAGQTDAWVRKLDAEGDPLWADDHAGEGGGPDAANGIDVLDGAATVAGFETVDGRARVWLRRYFP